MFNIPKKVLFSFFFDVLSGDVCEELCDVFVNVLLITWRFCSWHSFLCLYKNRAQFPALLVFIPNKTVHTTILSLSSCWLKVYWLVKGVRRRSSWIFTVFPCPCTLLFTNYCEIFWPLSFWFFRHERTVCLYEIYLHERWHFTFRTLQLHVSAWFGTWSAQFHSFFHTY